jgi:hypothetical protein
MEPEPTRWFSRKRTRIMKTSTRFALVATLILGIGWPSPAQQKDAIRIIMTEKLDKSKSVLEGIALADFSKIRSSAEKLIQLTDTEEWFTYNTPRYTQHTNEFRRAAENLIDRAKTKNLDGVTLAYFDLTMSCVRCHRYIRQIRSTRLSIPENPHLAE